MSYNIGDICYLLESNRFIRETKVIAKLDDFYILRFLDSGGGIQVKEHRLYPTEEAVQHVIDRKRRRLPDHWAF